MTGFSRRGALGAGAALLAAGGVAGRARAAGYPDRPIRFIVPYTPGGTTDVAARFVAEPLARALGQPVVVENRPGANSIVGAGAVAASPADGYNFAVVIGAHAANATLYKGKLPFDPVTSFAPVSLMVLAPLVMGAHAKLPFNDLQGMLAYARARPGALNYGSSGIGAAAHLTMEDLQLRTGIRMEHIPYRGTAPALQDLISGNIGVMFDSYSSLRAQFDSGSVKPIGFASAARPTWAANIPTLAEGGLADFTSSSWCLLLAPANTPGEIVARVSAEVAKIVQEPAAAERLRNIGFDPVGSTPDEAGAFLRDEVERWAKVITAAKVTVE
ncbi:MAG: Tripartite-type tricarboxylate transporter, receptor component TctC [Belnapia sp.]|nr:Tripartite-type tricarboxylate transporter, receptor component TctC [Belnapia sp.]